MEQYLEQVSQVKEVVYAARKAGIIVQTLEKRRG